jgi:hypothetical protein
MMRRSTISAFLALLWVALVAVACNLSGSPAPPTVSPRATSTPPPTIGYATLSPEELPTEAATPVPQVAAVAAAPVESDLLNLVNLVEADRLLFYIDSLQNMGTRHVNSATNRPDWGIGAAYNYVVGQFEQIRAQSQGRLTVFSQPFTVEWAGVRSQGQNVVAFLSGTEAGAGTIVLGAHYDSITINYENADVPAPGANDNASGMAALLEVARVLSQRPHRASIMFVAFAAEEVGRQGSAAFIKEYLAPRQIDISAMLNLDIIGSQFGPGGAVDDRNVRVFSAGPNDESPSRHLARTLNLIAFNHVPFMTLVTQDEIDREGRYGDHMTFTDAGYPSVRFTQPMDDPSHNHNDRDTLDNIQAGYLSRVTQTVLTLVTSLADGPRPPRDIVLRDAGAGVRTLVWEPVPDAAGYIVALRRPGALDYEQFEITDPTVTSVTWDGFMPDRFTGLAIAARDARGLMGPLSAEFKIR